MTPEDVDLIADRVIEKLDGPHRIERVAGELVKQARLEDALAGTYLLDIAVAKRALRDIENLLANVERAITAHVVEARQAAPQDA